MSLIQVIYRETSNNVKFSESRNDGKNQGFYVKQKIVFRMDISRQQKTTKGTSSDGQKY